jgi:hypothetical protein
MSPDLALWFRVGGACLIIVGVLVWIVNDKGGI